MKALSLFLLTALLPAQGPVRRAITPSTTNGWARVVVDDDGEQHLWIGDGSGRSIPFLWESDAKWSFIPLQSQHPLFGKDAKDHPTAAFTLHAPEGYSRGDREQVKVQLSLEAPVTPWACRVEVARRGDGGAFITLDDAAPRYLYDLGPDRSATSITLPWDSDDYRITLLPVQGQAPKVIGVEASACTLPTELASDERVELALSAGTSSNGQTLMTATLPGPRRLTAVDVTLSPPVAPVHVSVSGLRPSTVDRGEEASYLGSAELWNLPALSTLSARVKVDGTAAKLQFTFPESVTATSATAFIRHRRIFFPAEAGQSYFLHFGGLAKAAPGSLGQLPASSRAFYTGTALALGNPEPDPQAVQATPDAAAPLRRVLPWIVGILVLLLGLWGVRLMRRPDQTDLH